jgi:hypothetical protein
MLPYDSTIKRMRLPDLEKERSEKMLSVEEFLIAYNADLPNTFPPVSREQLIEFKKTYSKLFKDQEHWTLGQHRKKVMDWLL